MDKKLTEKECLEIGGHCWNYYDSNRSVDIGLGLYSSNPTQYRRCKHCGRKERKIEEWKEEEK